MQDGDLHLCVPRGGHFEDRDVLDGCGRHREVRFEDADLDATNLKFDDQAASLLLADLLPIEECLLHPRRAHLHPVKFALELVVLVVFDADECSALRCARFCWPSLGRDSAKPAKHLQGNDNQLSVDLYMPRAESPDRCRRVATHTARLRCGVSNGRAGRRCTPQGEGARPCLGRNR